MAETTAAEVHAFLSDRAEGRVIETHAARIYLLEDEAWKIKRPVVYDYLDFRDLGDRHAVLLRELELNKPTAPTLYHDVVPVTREADGKLAVDGAGEPVEWLLRMTRFPAEDELSAVAERGKLDHALSEELGQAIHKLHATCPVRTADGAKLITEILEEFEREFDTLTDCGAKVDATAVLAQLREVLSEVAPLLTLRTTQGFVRRCHGDLHLRNIVLLNGRPTPFDALEFDERLGTCDVLYDLAFLLMDIVNADLPGPANAVLNAYLEQDGSVDALSGLTALPLFGGVRAMVRAMVATEIQMGQGEAERDFGDAHHYLALAQKILQPQPPRLIAVGGLSGTGKTTISRAIAPDVGKVFGAIHVRSDVERKRLAGVDPLETLPETAYAAGKSAETYQAIMDRAAACLNAGRSAIVDAVFARPEQRAAITALAETCGVDFKGIWLTAPQGTRESRVMTRDADASDADASVVAKQAAYELGPMNWAEVSTDGSIAETADRVRSVLTC